MSVGVKDRLFAPENRTELAAGTVALAVLVIAPFVLGGFHTTLLAKTLIFAVFATAFNLLYGYTGFLSFGHAMFVATAGYTVAKVVQQVGPMLAIPAAFGDASVLVTWLLALALGTLMATLLAVFVGFLSVRLEEIYFAMITLSFSMAIWVIVNQDTIGKVLAKFGIGEGVFTNGSDGLTFILGEVNLFGFEFLLVDIADPRAYYFATLVISLLAMYGLYRVVNSPFGTTCKAVRENRQRAHALGINTRFHSWMTFIISGAFSGLAGATLIPLFTNVNPRYAHWTFSAEPVIMAVIGGPYSFIGPAVGAFIYGYFRWFISQIPALEAYWQFSFGVVLVVVVLFFDNGVAGGLKELRSRLRGRRGGSGSGHDSGGGGGGGGGDGDGGGGGDDGGGGGDDGDDGGGGDVSEAPESTPERSGG